MPDSSDALFGGCTAQGASALSSRFVGSWAVSAGAAPARAGADTRAAAEGLQAAACSGPRDCEHARQGPQGNDLQGPTAAATAAPAAGPGAPAPGVQGPEAPGAPVPSAGTPGPLTPVEAARAASGAALAKEVPPLAVGPQASAAEAAAATVAAVTETAATRARPAPQKHSSLRWGLPPNSKLPCQEAGSPQWGNSNSIQGEAYAEQCMHP